jgi:hypothetical protein
MILSATSAFQQPMAAHLLASRAQAIRTAVVGFGHGLKKDLFDSYRPELHYMRGPGPKWREKHTVRGLGQI